MFGPLQKTAFGYEGSFVSFMFNETTATVQNYVVLGPGRFTSVFQVISPDVTGPGTSGTNASVFSYESSAMLLRIYSNPVAAMLIQSKSIELNITFTLSRGVGPRGTGSPLKLTTAYFEGRLFVTGVATLTRLDTQVTAHLPPGTKAVFRANSEAGEGAVGVEGQESLADATVQSRLALEGFEIGFEGYVAASDVVYGEIAVDDYNLTANGIQITFDGDFASPKLMAFQIHSSILAADKNSTISVRFDGEDVTRIATFDEVVDYSGNDPACALAVGENGVLLLAQIPQPGSHILTVELVVPRPPPEGLNPIQLVAIVAIVVVLVGAAAAFMLRRKPPS